MIADRRLCVTLDGRLVEAGDLDSAYLLAAVGHEIAPEKVKALGLVVWSDGRVMQGPEPVADVFSQAMAGALTHELIDEPFMPQPEAAPEPKKIMPSQAKRSRGKPK